MSGFRRHPSTEWSGLPASKRPRVGSTSSNNQRKVEEDDDDAFADDDITGEELEQWEFVASQAEIRLTQERSKQQKINANHQSHKPMTNGSSFKLPGQTLKTTSASSNNSLVKDLQSKLAIYEKKIKDLEQSYKRKDGETMVLRDRLSTAEKNLNQEKMKILDIQTQHNQEEVERNKKVQKEIEKYKDQVQFKQAEIQESQNLIKNLEAKNKRLEQKASSSAQPASTSSRKGSGLSETGWTSTQESNHVATKKMRLVKPQSPRVQTPSVLQKPDFSDDPLGCKKPALPGSTSSRPSSSPQKMESLSEKSPSANFILKSKYVSKYEPGQAILHGLLSDQKIPAKLTKDSVSSPFLRLLKCENCNESLEAAKNLLHGYKGEEKFIGNFFSSNESSDVSKRKDIEDIYLLADRALKSFVNLQDSLSRWGQLSQGSGSYHTATSNLEVGDGVNRTATKKSKMSASDIQNICLNALSALQILDTVLSHSATPVYDIHENVPDLLSKILKICEFDKWNSKLLYYEDVTTASLNVVKILAGSAKKDTQMERFSPFVKCCNIVPLVSHCNIDIKCTIMDALIHLTSYTPFAQVIVKEDSEAGTPSILCHVCDVACLETPKGVSNEAWLNLSGKIITFLSVLTATHEALLIEHSCFCEIYHAADVLLYNQLMLWKQQDEHNFTRSGIIKSSLCLLHSCANVYSEGIPNSRRDHRHQFTLINLEKFLEKEGNEDSLWSQQLSKIVKAEVKAIFDETETS